ncbi:MAG: FAD-dependent oxidoreductase [Reyranella sp.]|nr:FAD-dependent oxidoreductase [Reyranella sp.]
MDGGHFHADVVVVGGGPAGSAAAIACASRGLQVLLLERDACATELPGETLHPGAEPLLAQLGLSGRLSQVTGARHEGVWIEWGSPRRFEPFGADEDGPWRGLQVSRADFDALLRTRARELGVEVRQPCVVTAPLVSEARRSCVMTSEGPVVARMVVDASGRSRWLGRALGIDSPARSPRLIVRYGYVEGACPARDAAPALVGDDKGWTWTACVRPGRYQWTRLDFTELPDADWLPDELRDLTPVSRSRGADVTWRMADDVARPGWFMVGDAAAILDPTSSRGVLKALMSGIMAGHLIAGVLHDKAPADEAAQAYQAWMSDWFEADIKNLSAFYRMLGSSYFV